MAAFILSLFKINITLVIIFTLDVSPVISKITKRESSGETTNSADHQQKYCRATESNQTVAPPRTNAGTKKELSRSSPDSLAIVRQDRQLVHMLSR